MSVEDGEGEVKKEVLVVGNEYSTFGVAIEVGDGVGFSVEIGEDADGIGVDVWLVSAGVIVVIGVATVVGVLVTDGVEVSADEAVGVGVE
jgi:hypothetical protein